MSPDDNMPEISWCARLRNERERRQIPLSSIAANTKISASLFAALERGDVSRWPSGIFRRSFIRAYASAIGLDPDETVREFVTHFPDPLQPAAPPGASAVRADTSGLRLKLADAPTPFVAGKLLGGVGRRSAAAACDGGVVLVIALCAFIVFDIFWLPLGVAMIGYYLGGILLLGNTPGVCLLAPGGPVDAGYNRPPDEAAQADDDRQAHSDWRFRVPAR